MDPSFKKWGGRKHWVNIIPITSVNLALLTSCVDEADPLCSFSRVCTGEEVSFPIKAGEDQMLFDRAQGGIPKYLIVGPASKDIKKSAASKGAQSQKAYPIYPII